MNDCMSCAVSFAPGALAPTGDPGGRRRFGRLDIGQSATSMRRISVIGSSASMTRRSSFDVRK